MVILRQIQIEGFRGIIKPLTYKLDSPGINVITGPNGAGKSTIVTDALAWVLWKKLVKKGKTSMIPWPSVMGDDFQGTMVQLEFSVGDKDYTIIRCLDFKRNVDGSKGKNRLIIYENGEEVFRDLRGKADHQAWINKKLGYSFDLFKSTILFTQELDRLMEESGPDKKQIFDEAFESVFIQRARDTVEKRYTGDKKYLKELEGEIEVMEAKLNNLESTIRFFEKQIKNFEKDKRERLGKLEVKLVELEKQGKEQFGLIKYFKKQQKKFSNFDFTIKALRANIDLELTNAQFKSEMAILGKEHILQQILDKKSGLVKEYASTIIVCSKCGKKQTPYEIQENKKVIKKQIDELAPSIKEQEYRLNQLREELVEITHRVVDQTNISDRIKKLEQLWDRYSDAETNLKQCRKNKKEINERYEDTAEEHTQERRKQPPENNLPGLMQDKTNEEALLEAHKVLLKQTAKKVNIDKWLLNDPLSNSGLKAFIFDSMLKKVNNYLKQYTHLVRFQINIFVDMNMATKPISVSVIRGNEEVPYEDLSKGQKQLVHVSIAMALNDTLNEVKPINILILDELFESLDPENIEAVWNIIQSKQENKSIHIITHRTQFQPSNAKHIPIVQNKQGQSVIKM